jgi:hypothetical protein
MLSSYPKLRGVAFDFGVFLKKVREDKHTL